MLEIILIFATPLFTTIGFFGKYLWDIYINKGKKEILDKIKLIEFRLNKFYYPIFFYLKREQIIWDKILYLNNNCYNYTKNYNNNNNNVKNDNLTIDKIYINDNNIQNDDINLVNALDQENLIIHKNVQKIIHDNISIALPTEYLQELLLEYDEHVTVYQILRELNIKKFPIDYGAPYPKNLLPEIDKRIKDLSLEYKKYNLKIN